MARIASIRRREVTAMRVRITDVPIRDAWRALGGGPLRGNRGRAWWREGNGYNVALDDGGRWFDHARGEGGGVLTLVQTALGIDRRAALEWLANRFGVDIGGGHSVAERRHYAQRIEAARTLAVQLVQRRDDYLLDLRTAAGMLLSDYHRLLRLADETEDIELVARAAEVWELLEVVASRRDQFRSATGPELVALFSGIERQVAA